VKVQLLVLQSTPFCNLDCTYCYLPNRDARDRMSPRVIRAAVENVIRNDLLGERLCVVWHSGEPLVPGPGFYRTAFEQIREAVAGRCPVHHSIQTNGTLLDDPWCDLFAEHDIRVGVSIDGPAHIHDRARRTRDGRGTHAQVMRGVEHLLRRRIPFHALAVLTAASLGAADEIYRFFADAGIREVGFNIDEREGVNRRSSIAPSQEAGVEAFFARLHALCARDGNQLKVREFDQARAAILHGLGEIDVAGRRIPRNAQVLPLEIVSVDHAGNFSTFSPELIGQTEAAYANFVFGNVLTDELTSVFDDPHFERMFEGVMRGVQVCAGACECFALCGGGAPANKLYENGSFASGETSYCRTTVKVPIRLVLGQLERGLRG
jgi:uncharacterized protein